MSNHCHNFGILLLILFLGFHAVAFYLLHNVMKRHQCLPTDLVIHLIYGKPNFKFFSPAGLDLDLSIPSPSTIICSLCGKLRLFNIPFLAVSWCVSNETCNKIWNYLYHTIHECSSVLFFLFISLLSVQ